MNQTFTEAYIEAALWSSTDDSDTPMDEIDNELSTKAREQMTSDCADFQTTNAELLESWYSDAGESEDRAGHDFWLTRNGHGAGFWDRWSGSTPQAEIGRKLTDAAHAYGSCDLYVGDDGEIYAS